jgi:protoporphyrinogen oxidase
VIEAAPHLGGLASAWNLGDITWDRHYHVILGTDTALCGVLEQLGIAREIQWARTRTGFYVDKQHYSMSNSREFLTFPPLNLIDKVRLAATILYASRVNAWHRLEDVLVEDWLRQWSGTRLSEKIWLPLLRAKLGENYRKTSAAFIWATLKRYYGARSSGGAKTEMFGCVTGGYARILERFRAVLVAAGAEIQLGTPVQRVEPDGMGGVRVVLAGGKSQRFDQVAVTVASPVAVRLCPSLSDAERQRHERIEYMGIVCASLLLKQPLEGFYVTNICDATIPFTGVIEMSALVDRAQFGGHTLVYLPKYVEAQDAALAWTDREVEDTFLPAFLKMYPKIARPDILSFRVSREKYVMALPTLHYSAHLPPVSTSLPGLHIVNSAHIINGTLNVNETVQLAEREVARLLARPQRAALVGEAL